MSAKKRFHSETFCLRYCSSVSTSFDRRWSKWPLLVLTRREPNFWTKSSSCTKDQEAKKNTDGPRPYCMHVALIQKSFCHIPRSRAGRPRRVVATCREDAAVLRLQLPALPHRGPLRGIQAGKIAEVSSSTNKEIVHSLLPTLRHSITATAATAC